MAQNEPNRLVPRVYAALTFHLPDGWRGQVIDLSATGLRIKCLAVLEANAKLEGTLEMHDGRRVPLAVRVVWTSAPSQVGYAPAEVGFELLEPPPEYHAALADLFARDEA